MMVLVDTSIWSMAFRIRYIDSDPYVNELKQLIMELNARMIPPIRQEILSGVTNSSDFETLRHHLEAFDDIELLQEDYEEAARLAVLSREKKIAVSATDLLLCAVSMRCNCSVFSTEKQFEELTSICSLTLHQPREMV